jgi:hypothetical protein
MFTIKEKIIIKLILGLIDWLGRDVEGFCPWRFTDPVRKLIDEKESV